MVKVNLAFAEHTSGRVGHKHPRADLAMNTPDRERCPPAGVGQLRAKMPLKVGLQPDEIAGVGFSSIRCSMATGAEYKVTGGDSVKEV